MRLVVVLAGTFGFLTVLFGNVAGDKPLEATLVNGIVSALIAGLILRWWMRLWISSLEQVSRDDEMSARLDQIESDADAKSSGSKSSEFRKP
jgi:Co/Zn/Cd efflux system component